MKKILIFSLTYHPLVGGLEIAIAEITNRIADIEFHLVTLRFYSSLPQNETLGNVHVHRIGWGIGSATIEKTFSPLFYVSKILFVPAAAYAGFKLHKRHHFDGLWAMMSYMIFPIVLLRFVGVWVPYILTLQEGDTFKRTFKRVRIMLVSPLLRFGIHRSCVVQAISTYLAGWARELGYEGPIEVIPNGVDVKRFLTVEDDRNLRKKLLGAASQDCVLITVSRLVKKNAVDIIIRALSLLPKNMRLVVVGEGPELLSLKVLAQELNVFDRIQFVGEISNETLPPYLHAADIFIRPSRSEGMGISFIEAMAAGLPVIATQVGGIADFLFDAQRDPEKEPTGFAVDVDSPDQIAQKVQFIREHPHEVAVIVASAKKLLQRQYDWDIIAFNMKERVFAKV